MRVSKPETVSVDVSEFDVGRQEGDRVKVSFTQAYRANHYRDQVTKTLELRAEGDGWKIMRETSN